MWLDDLDNVDETLEHNNNLCGCSGICTYCNEKILNNDLYYCESCDTVSDLTIKDTFCPCLENKDVKIRNYDKIEKYVEHAYDKKKFMRKNTFWTSKSAENVHYLKINDILNIPKAIYHNIAKITGYLESWWWKIDAEDCLCEECRNKLLLENSDDD